MRLSTLFFKHFLFMLILPQIVQKKEKAQNAIAKIFKSFFETKSIPQANETSDKTNKPT